VAFLAGGDGGRRSPEHPAQRAHIVCGSLPIAEQSRFMSTRPSENMPPRIAQTPVALVLAAALLSVSTATAQAAPRLPNAVFGHYWCFSRAPDGDPDQTGLITPADNFDECANHGGVRFWRRGGKSGFQLGRFDWRANCEVSKIELVDPKKYRVHSYCLAARGLFADSPLEGDKIFELWQSEAGLRWRELEEERKNAVFATDGGKLNLICTVRHSANVPMWKSPSSSTITGAVENNAVVTLLREDGAQWAHIRKNVGTTGWIHRNYLDCSTSLQMPEPLRGEWCHSASGGMAFFMGWHLHRDYSSCDESLQPELLVLSDEVQIDKVISCRPIQVTKFDVCERGHGHIIRDDSRLGYHVKLLCKQSSYETPAHDWIVGGRHLDLGPKRDRIPCPR
jgi:Bacterial SH3 domain